MFRIATIFALICSFLQVAPLANAATNEQQNPAKPVNAVIEWKRTLSLTPVVSPHHRSLAFKPPLRLRNSQSTRFGLTCPCYTTSRTSSEDSCGGASAAPECPRCASAMQRRWSGMSTVPTSCVTSREDSGTAAGLGQLPPPNCSQRAAG